MATQVPHHQINGMHTTDDQTPQKQRRTAQIQLVPMDLHDPKQFSTLQSQRQICGWNKDTHILESFRAAMDAGERTLFWITVPSSPLPPKEEATAVATPLASTPASQTNGHPTTTTQTSEPLPPVRTNIPFPSLIPILAGHISLDHPTPTEAATGFGASVLDGHTMKIAYLFITPPFRRLSVADSAIALLERLACEEPYGKLGCTKMVVDTISKKYMREEGPDGRGIWERLGREMRDGFSTQEWFEGKGYLAYGGGPKYRERLSDGTEYLLEAVYSRKVLGR